MVGRGGNSRNWLSPLFMLIHYSMAKGKWYYLNSNQDGSAGIMYSKRRTPDGWYVKEDGSWDEEAGR